MVTQMLGAKLQKHIFTHFKSAVSNFTENSGQTKIVIYVKFVVKVFVSFISSEKRC